MKQQRRWHNYPSRDRMAAATVCIIGDCARVAIAGRGEFSIVLAGGASPEAVYARLVDLDTDWPAWRVYFGDERCVAVGDALRNDGMARRVWLDRVSIPKENILSMPAEAGADAGATRYAALLRDVGTFDLVLLGLGEDGHTASLFPGRSEGMGPDAADAVAVHESPKPPPDRISLSARRLSRARRVIFLVAGAEPKRDALRRWRDGEPLPAASIIPPGGVDILVAP